MSSETQRGQRQATAGGAAGVGGQGLPLASDSARATPAEPAPAAQAPREP